jgi:hypothetical protein
MRHAPSAAAADQPVPASTEDLVERVLRRLGDDVVVQAERRGRSR